MTSHTITKGMIVDDHPIVRTGIAGMLGDSSEYRIVCEARNGREAVEQYPVHRPDVTLMDLRMPEMDGTTAASAIRRDFPSARSIIFSSHDGDEDIYRGLRAGAKAFLLMSALKEEFLQAIETVCCGQMHISPDVATKLAKRMSVSKLTSRETEVLTLVARGASAFEPGTRGGTFGGAGTGVDLSLQAGPNSSTPPPRNESRWRNTRRPWASSLMHERE